jgi:hypothetical protein
MKTSNEILNILTMKKLDFHDNEHEFNNKSFIYENKILNGYQQKLLSFELDENVSKEYAKYAVDKLKKLGYSVTLTEIDKKNYNVVIFAPSRIEKLLESFNILNQIKV